MANFKIEVIGSVDLAGPAGVRAQLEEKGRILVDVLKEHGEIRSATLQAEGKITHLDKPAPVPA
jgi:succinate dehydrogenase/fumarate reductase flavoprotein subunit